MANRTPERRLAAIVAIDVAGYGRLIEADESGTRAALRALRDEEIAQRVAAVSGRIVGSAGDSFLIEFQSVVDAVSCVVDFQRAIAARMAALPAERRVLFRAGVNVGDVLVEGGDIHGEGVNLAARLQTLAEAGGICVSGKVYEEVRHRLDIGFEDLGAQEVKHVSEPVQAYRVLLDPAAAGTFKAPRGLPWRWLAPLAAAVAGVGVALGLVFSGTQVETGLGRASEARMAHALPARPSIAVLPFVNLSDDPKQEFFADGLTEDLITDLSKVSGLFVIARNSVFTYKGRAVRVERVAEELGVRYVLEGSVRLVEGDVRINAQLIDATEGHHIWADRFDRAFNDIFAVQDEVVGRIVTALSVNVSDAEEIRLTEIPTDNMDAYQLYLQAREIEAAPTPQANAHARRQLLGAIALDARFAAAYEELGWTYFREWVFGWSTDSTALDRALEAAVRANTIGGARARCHELIGHIYLWQRRYQEALEQGRKSILLEPNNARAYSALGEHLTWAGRPDEAIELIQRAIRLDPEGTIFYNWNLGHAFWLAGRADEALAEFAAVIEREPNWMPARAFLAAIHAERGELDEARDQMRAIRQIAPDVSIDVISARLPYRRDEDLARVLRALAIAHEALGEETA